MAAKTKSIHEQKGLLSLTKLYFGLAGIYAGYIIVSDAWHLTTRQLTFWRWEMFGVLLVVTTVVAYLARQESKSSRYYQALVVAQILVGIALATFAVYTERGMASRAVALYFIPIVSAGVLRQKSAVYAAAALATAAYVLAATRYFYVNFNEGYKVELYSTLGFYAAVFFGVAALVALARRNNRG